MMRSLLCAAVGIRIGLAGATLFAADTSLPWQAGAGFRSAPLSVPASGRTGFALLRAAQTGITFTNHLSDATVSTNRLTEIGSGVALVWNGATHRAYRLAGGRLSSIAYADAVK